MPVGVHRYICTETVSRADPPGPHLEIGLRDSSGTPIGTETAGTMPSLQPAY